MISKYLCSLMLAIVLMTGTTACTATEPFAAGAIIYGERDGEIFLLLADHVHQDRGWGSFGGKREGKSVRDTAVAEAHEETGGYYPKDVLYEAIKADAPFASNPSGTFVSYVIKMEMAPIEELAKRAKRHENPYFRERRPYAWIPLSVVLDVAASETREIPAQYLPEDRKESHLWPAFIEVLQDARAKKLL